MSRVLFLQCYRRPPGEPVGPRYEAPLGVLSAMLKADGHTTRLMPVTHFDAAVLGAALKETSPDVVLVYIDGTAVDLARRTLGALAESDPPPIVAAGTFATLMPSTALSMPAVNAVVVGEVEQVFRGWVRSGLNGGASDERLPGVMLRSEGRPATFRPAPLIDDLDALPPADRSIFGYPPSHTCFDVVTSRGCPMRCAYCTNDALRGLHDDPPGFVRRRSPDHVCDEIDDLCMNFPETQRLRFPDHAFALDYAWLESFADVYAHRCGLPFSCHLRANSVDEPTVEALDAAGCDEVEIEIVSGSNFIRNEILEMDTSARQIERTFELLADRGIRTRSINYVGVPYSSEITESDTVRLNRRLKPDFVQIRVYYPFPNTKAAGIAEEMGWMSNRGEACFTEDRSVLDMPTLPAKAIARVARRMSQEINEPPRQGWRAALGRLPIFPGWRLSDLLGTWLDPRGGDAVAPRR